MPCAYGKLVAEFFGDPGEYDGIAVDLVRNDGKKTQCCIAEVKPDGKLHTLSWDGEHDEAVHDQAIDPFGSYVY